MMSEKLKEISDQLYHDGVQKAEIQAQKIIENAKDIANQKIIEAEKASKVIINEAQTEINILKKKVHFELNQEALQIIEKLKQDIMKLLFTESFKDELKELNESKKLVELVLELIHSWQGDSGVQFKVPKKIEEGFLSYAQASIKEKLNQGIEIKFDGGFDNGFEIIHKKDNYLIRFNEETFIEFFKVHLRPQIHEFLFSSGKE